MKYNLSNDYYELTICDTGAEITSLKSKDGYEFLWQGMPGLWDRQAPILFPLCGSLADSKYYLGGKEYEMSLHGFAMNKSFALKELSESKAVFELSSDTDTKRNYPFDFILTASYELSGDKLIFTAKVKNTSDKAMPYMFGWHPGFNLPTCDTTDVEDYLVDVGVNSLRWCPMNEDGNFITDNTLKYLLPDGKYHLNCKEIYPNDTMIFFGAKNSLSLYAPCENYRMDMKCSDNLTTLWLWKEPVDEAKFICVEPLCEFHENGISDNDFDKRKMPRLQVGEEETYRYEITLASPNGSRS